MMAVVNISSHGQPGVLDPNMVKLASDQVITDSTFVDVTGFTFEGAFTFTLYYFQFIFVWKNADQSSGLKLRCSGPGDSDHFRAYMSAGGGSGGDVPGGNAAQGDRVANAFTDELRIPNGPAADTEFLAVYEGIWIPSTTGTFKIQAASTNTNDLTLVKGSTMFAWGPGF